MPTKRPGGREYDPPYQKRIPGSTEYEPYDPASRVLTCWAALLLGVALGYGLGVLLHP